MVGLGLFAPLPLAVMIPFMAGQSFAMGEAFGKGFQYGKRKVSSMTNEEFNASSGPQMFAETTADITQMIPTMSNAMEKFHTLQTDIILKMIDYIAKLPAEVLPDLAAAPGLLVPQEFKIKYQEEVPKLIETILNKLGIDTTGPSRPFSPVAASLAPPPLVQTPDTSTQIRLQNEIDRLKQEATTKTSSNPNVSKVTEVNNIRTTYNNKGQIVSQEVINKNLIPKSQTAQSTSAQTIVKTFTPPAKLRAPSSVITEVKKLKEQLKALDKLLILQKGARNFAGIQNNVNNSKRIINGKIAALNNKYAL